MKIALCGSAPSSIGKAPFKNSKFNEWLEGKVEPESVGHGAFPNEDWDIWACSPGCWAVIPRATRFFEVHRWEPGMAWFSPEYVNFLCKFPGIVYTGAPIPEIVNHVVYPIDRMEEKFSSYFMTSSLALMMAMAIDTIEEIRAARRGARRVDVQSPLPQGVDESELGKNDSDDVIGMWGVDMCADEEWGYQRPGCQFFVLEAMRRGIGMYMPPESDLMRPMPVYGISEWDHNYIKLTARSRETNNRRVQQQAALEEATKTLMAITGEMHALNYFVNTWTSPYGMQHGMVVRHTPGTGLGSGITHFDGRPIERMVAKDVMDAMSKGPDIEAVNPPYIENDPLRFVINKSQDVDAVAHEAIPSESDPIPGALGVRSYD